MPKNEFMKLAVEASKKSKDPSTQVGAVIVSNEQVVGVGYNKMPKDKDTFPWDRKIEKDENNNPILKNTKYPYVVHAEMNAYLEALDKSQGADIYVTLYPCSNCAKFLVQAGIKKIYYADDKYHDTDDAYAARKIFEDCHVDTELITA